jgi:hypothetical protein
MAALQNNSRAELQLHWYITISSLLFAVVPLISATTVGQHVPNIRQESPSSQLSPWLGVLLPRLQTHRAQPLHSSLVNAMDELSHVTRLLGIQPMPRAAHSSSVVVYVVVYVVVVLFVVMLLAVLLWIGRSHQDPWTVTGIIHATSRMIMAAVACGLEETKSNIFMMIKQLQPNDVAVSFEQK